MNSVSVLEEVEIASSELRYSAEKIPKENVEAVV